MAIQFLCPRCQASIKVPDKAAGKKGPCPQCGQRLQVPRVQRQHTVLGVLPDAPTQEWTPPTEPLPTPSSPTVFSPPSDEGASALSHYSTPRGTRLGCIALSIVLLLVMGVGGVILLLSLSGKENGPEAQRSGDARSTSLPQPSPVEKTTRPAPPQTSSLLGGIIFLLVLIVSPFLYLLFWVLTLIWVARDAKNRSIDGGAMWVIIVFFTHFLGLLVYIASRPSGSLTTCEWCQNRKLDYARLCPHCGQAAAV